MLRHSLTNVLSNSVPKWRAHTRTNEGDGLPRAFFALGGARGGVLGRRKVESTRDHHAHREVRDRLCHFRCHPLGREGGGWQNAASCSLLHSFPFLSPGRFRHPVVLGKSESISCLPCFRTRRRPRLTSTFRQNGERLVLRRRRFCRFAEWSFGEGPFC